jgi:hypothetical protein
VVERPHNPSFEGTWIDEHGHSWRRKGKRGRVLEDRRIRTLLSRDDVPLIVWRSFEVTAHNDVTAKLAVWDQLRRTVAHDYLSASEWQGDGGGVLLMLEHHC